MRRELFIERLGRSLSLSVDYTERVPLQGGRLASVLICFAFSKGDSEPRVLLIQRADTGGPHSGQMAFPGGMAEPDEGKSHEGVRRTALRETEEEVGLKSEWIEVFGQLPSLTTITQFEVTPVVGVLRPGEEEVQLVLDPAEVQQAIWVPWSQLLAPETYRKEWVTVGAIRYPIHVYQIGPHRVWGATGSMLKNLLDRWNSLR
jgi:8-oxo-dGTP pyrophosphatase MutT (NUDIX family)